MAEANPPDHFVCLTCGKTFNDRLKFQRHVYEHANEQCPFCDKHFQTTSALIKHKRRSHPDQIPPTFRCNYCGYIRPNKSAVAAHLRGHDINEITENQQTFFVCHLCRMRFQRRPDWNTHLGQHQELAIHENGMYKCFICGNEFQQLIDLNIHLQRSHQILDAVQTFTCNICQQVFQSMVELIVHELTYHTEGDAADAADATDATNAAQTFTCNICHKVFYSRNLLRVHEVISHTEEVMNLDTFACDICHHIYDSHDELLNHMKFHTVEDGVQTFICELCQQVFYSMDDLVTHEYVYHLNE